MKRARGGKATSDRDDSVALSAVEEIEIDEEGPASQPSKMIRGRTTKTMYRDLCHAAVDTNASMADLINEGLRYVLYGVQPRHVGVRKKAIVVAA